MSKRNVEEYGWNEWLSERALHGCEGLMDLTSLRKEGKYESHLFVLITDRSCRFLRAGFTKQRAYDRRYYTPR